ncbi:MAG: hypothetical protein RLZZ587_928, partial [Actinomycetota bacterium]
LVVLPALYSLVEGAKERREIKRATKPAKPSAKKPRAAKA